MFNNPLSFIDPTGLTANSANVIHTDNPEQIKEFWEWLTNNWDNNQDNSSSWPGGGSIMDGIWSYLTTGGFGRQGHGALGYDSNGNPGINFQWWGPITGQAYQDIHSTLVNANTAFTIPWALHHEFIRLDIINPLMYKNEETMSFRGHDFMLYQNKWHLLPPLREIPLQGYQDPFDTERKPTQMTMSREKWLKYELDKKLMRQEGLKWGVGSTIVCVLLEYLLIGKVATTPVAFLIGYTTAAISALHNMEQRMREHDRHVDNLRLNLGQ